MYWVRRSTYTAVLPLKQEKGLFMNTEKIAKDAVDKAQDVANDVLDGAEQAVDKTRKAMHSAAHKAERAIDEFGNEKRLSIDSIASRAQSAAERGINYAADTSHRAREQFYRAQERANEYVSDQPGKSMAIAMAAGAALATLVIMATRRRD